MARLFRPSIVYRLTVPGRRTGQERSIAIAVLDHDGRRYLMSAFGDTEWSRNLRAAGHGRLDSRRGHEEFRATEVPVAERGPLIAAYLDKYRKLPTVEKTFAALPDPADHPTFRIEPVVPAR
jgi:deazaflavin-dependent oxidoreductase (nitroreductase family)